MTTMTLGWKNPPPAAPISACRAMSNAYPSGDYTRSAPRHGKQVNAAFFDGHVLKLRNSDIGYNLSRTDPAALWPKNNKPDGP